LHQVEGASLPKLHPSIPKYTEDCINKVLCEIIASLLVSILFLEGFSTSSRSL
jgi:hypothetical protein